MIDNDELPVPTRRSPKFTCQPPQGPHPELIMKEQ